jgi:peptidoglycan/xylan/chitin deacetylase (PgdA/CDA1 family)
MRNTIKCTYVCLALIVLLSCSKRENHFTLSHGAIVRGDTTAKEIALVFTGDGFGDGGKYISELLGKENSKASFFLTGNFYRNREFGPIIRELLKNGNYLGSHSDSHLLYCDWTKRDSLLVSKREFIDDLNNSFSEMAGFGIEKEEAIYFLPPYEWYNDTIASWSYESGLKLINFTGGTRSNADYTYPGMGSQYVDSKTIYNSIISYEQQSVSGMNGFILLVHIGTDPRRTDKFYFYLPELFKELKNRGYRFVRIDELLPCQLDGKSR